MYVQVKTIDGERAVTLTISKLTSVADLKQKIQASFNVDIDCQRLFYGGKQLEDDYKIFDYNVKLNDVIQLMIRRKLEDIEKTTPKPSSSCEAPVEFECESDYFNVGDVVDIQESVYGSWVEARVLSIVKRNILNDTIDQNALKFPSLHTKNAPFKVVYPVKNMPKDGLIYKVQYEGGDQVIDMVPLKCIRLRARQRYKIEDLSCNQLVMVNYNIESPKERGYWYDFLINEIENKRSKSCITGTLFVGKENIPIENVKITFVKEIMKIEPYVLLSERKQVVPPGDIPLRETAPCCTTCRDRKGVKCKECGCQVCCKKDNPDKLLLCDECDLAYHLYCLNPPLENLPDSDDWYCPDCKNDENEIVKAGEKLKESKKKAKLLSNTSNTNRDWGKGMACVGRTKVCTIVPSNHYGPVPGIEVGTCWKFRLQVSEAGIHRPHVAGIHGRENDGAYSLVLSGGYEDDVDNGEEFLYTGSGGRDLSGNKRTSNQCFDQTLTRMNKALALNCAAPLNINGAKAKDWKKGKPVRVVRNYKLAKHSKYAPIDGNRYDGIYKVVQYYSQKGKSGFSVWRYVLRRDDPTPAPWTNEGMKHVKKLGLDMIYPDGYLEAMSDGNMENNKSSKRKRESEGEQKNSKKVKALKFELNADVKNLIKNDEKNSKLWEECNSILKSGKLKFLEKVTDLFLCICCQELVYNPVTTSCLHNFCLSCIKRSFSAEVYTCPYCRHDLGVHYNIEINENLSKILLKLFPGYEVGR